MGARGEGGGKAFLPRGGSIRLVPAGKVCMGVAICLTFINVMPEVNLSQMGCLFACITLDRRY